MKRYIVALVALATPLLAQAQINTLPSAPHLLVKGHAEGRYVPDRFTVNLLVDVTDTSPGKARARVEALMKTLLAAIDTQGAMPGRTHATSLSIGPSYDYEHGKRVFNGTKVSRHVSATFDSLDKMRAFIDGLPAGGEEQVTGTSVGRSDHDRIMMRLRAKAIANSKAAAKQLASAYHMRLKGVYSVSEVAPDFAYGIHAGSWGGGNGAVQEQSAMAPAPPSMSMSTGHVRASLRAGTIRLQQNMYAVYLVAPAGN